MKHVALAALLLSATLAPAQLAANWTRLRNPVLSYPHWSIKDPAMARQNGAYYIFSSAFYQDHGRLRSHVVEVSTRDFRTFSAPLFNFDGESDGFIGMCTPDVQKLGDTWVLVFNSWGDDPHHPDQLFYKTSRDLAQWSSTHPLAANITAGRSVIGPSITRIGKLDYASWRDGLEDDPKNIRVRIASAPDLAGPWQYVGSGNASLAMASGADNGRIHENQQFFWIDGTLHMVSDDYNDTDEGAFLYILANPADPLTWTKGYELQIPLESFNQATRCEAAALYDWRQQDGYFYLIYDAANEHASYEGRGWKRLALARSKDLLHWSPAGR
jgi:hypothetical protein